MQARGSMDAAAKASRNMEVPSCLVPYGNDTYISSLSVTVAKQVSRHLIHCSFVMFMTDLSLLQIRTCIFSTHSHHTFHIPCFLSGTGMRKGIHVKEDQVQK